MQLQGTSTIQPRKGHQIDRYQGGIHTISKLRHGKGIYTYDNTFFTYEGSYENGKKDGQGIIRFKDGRVINATFVNDQMNGSAQIQYPDGSKFKGELFLGEKEGRGIYTSIYERYDGEWKNNCKHGQGTYINYSIKEQYSGQYKFDKPHGYGNLTRWNYSFKGNFENGLKNGQGIEISDWIKDQDSKNYLGRYEYDGHFLNDKFSGKGIFKSRQSKYTYTGQFTDGIPNLYPNQFRCFLSTNIRNGEQISQSEKILLNTQPIQYQLEGDSFNLYLQTVYQGPQALDQIQPTQEEIQNLIKNWQAENKKIKNPPPMPDFNQPRMKKPEMIIVSQETGRQILIKLFKQVDGKQEYLKIDYRAQIVSKRRQNQEIKQEALKKAEEEGNKKGGKKDNKGQPQLKVNIYKQNPLVKQKTLKILTNEGKCSIIKFQLPDDFPQGKYFLEFKSSFKDFGQIKTLKKDFIVKTKIAKKK